ncbi:MAG: lytic murein transglycosylase [Candidatus Moranbacteria bacterium]|jgi:hypothetical protein|nr:lytic murein transglycosylase [Candidatus Moranbacteria bacterium]
MKLKNKKNKKWRSVFFLAVFLLACFLAGGNFFIVLGNEQENEVSEEEKAKAEEKEKKVEDLEKELEDEKAEKQEKVQEKIIISNNINQINKNISIIESRISDTEESIEKIKLEISLKEENVKKKNKMVADILREINQADSEVRLFLLGNEIAFDDYFLTLDLFQQMEARLNGAIFSLKQERKELDEKKQEQEAIFAIHEDQKNTLEQEQKRKYAVLNQTQSEINEKDAEIADIQAKISKLKNDISSLLGKGYDAKDIEDAARFASKVTGVRKDFLMGMLVIESDLGRYTGGCDYKESRMSKHRKELFKDICEELDYNYKKMKVSCPPAGYSGTGGAMGVAQFMSDTWMGYKSDIAGATGHNPPDPWNLTDGVTAMALKLAKVPGVTKHKESAECDAAKLYLSGTTSGSYNWYCDRVLYWADNYEKLME